MLLFAAWAAGFCSQPNSKNERLQGATDLAMERQAGAAVVVEVNTGEILAAHGLDLAAQRLERPGSTLKPFAVVST